MTISSNTYIHDLPHVHLKDLGVSSLGIRIGNNVWIGAGALCGTRSCAERVIR